MHIAATRDRYRSAATTSTPVRGQEMGKEAISVPQLDALIAPIQRQRLDLDSEHPVTERAGRTQEPAI
jgi:hypothetical protein